MHFTFRAWLYPFVGISGLENSTRPLVFTSASGCKASENFDISSINYFYPYMPILFVMQGKCLFKDFSRPADYHLPCFDLSMKVVSYWRTYALLKRL